MGTLSNFLEGHDADGLGATDAGASRGAAPAVCRPARAHELQEALRLVLSHDGRPAENRQVSDFLQFAAHRNIDAREVWVAESGGRMLWAILPIVSPGRTMLLFTPTGGSPREQEVGPLVEAICGHFGARGVHLAQVLLDPGDEEGRRLYARHDFAHIAELIYLQATVRRKAAPPVLPGPFAWLNYSPDTHGMFAATIAESYHQSLDCPALNGLRDIEDVVAGHKASGEFDPQCWFLLCEGADPRAVLLLSRMPRSDAAELVYLGLVPGARGRGLGDLLMRQALAVVASMGLSRLSLAVDSKNVPALKLYYRRGMHRIASKMALMRKC